MKTQPSRAAPREANYQTASTWWSDARDHWTPIGWKHHFFRFNVLFNGTILAEPAHSRNARAQRWAGQGLQLAAWPSPMNSNRPGSPTYLERDNGLLRQGWEDSPAPLLWTEWAEDGVLFREHAFAHMAGAGDVESGIEPLFAWVRLSVHRHCEPLPMDARRTFNLELTTPHVMGIMTYRNNLLFRKENTAYPRRLKAAPARGGARRGLRLVEPNGKVRLVVLPPRGAKARFSWRPKGDPRSFLTIEVDNRPGEYVDLLLPMLPTEPGVLARELALGYEGALRQAERFWSRQRTPTDATVETPEPEINASITHGLRLASIISEKNPADGRYAMLLGTIKYEQIWCVPYATVITMFLDCMGRHEETARYLRIIKDHQGQSVPPAEGVGPHPGCYTNPRTHACIDWFADHGGILYAASQHALWSHDAAFIAEWTDSIVAGCDFVKYARRVGHRGVKGLLPPGVCNDRQQVSQAVSNDAFLYWGLRTAVRFLTRVGHPRAAEFAREAKDYHDRFQEVYRAACRKGIHWTDARGRRRPLPPPALYADDPREIPVAMRHAFYLDGGPLLLVFAGLLRASDPIMTSLVDWFRHGPPTEFHRGGDNACCWQLPSLIHEVSSCEPCASWNIFHTWQLGQRSLFLEGLYSLFTGAMSRQTYIDGETRGGVFGSLFTHAPAVYLARLSVIDDQLEEGSLHLARLIPLAWVTPEKETRFENMPTEFGPVSLRVRLGRDRKTLHVSLDARFRFPPGRILLHVPPIDTLRAIRLNGRSLRWDGKRRRIALRPDWTITTGA